MILKKSPLVGKEICYIAGGENSQILVGIDRARERVDGRGIWATDRGGHPSILLRVVIEADGIYWVLSASKTGIMPNLEKKEADRQIRLSFAVTQNSLP